MTDKDRLSLGSVVRAALSLLNPVRTGWSVWFAAFLLTSTADFLLTLFRNPVSKSPTSEQLFVFFLEALGMLWITTAGYRALLGYHRNVWRMDRAMTRYAVVEVLMIAGTLPLRAVAARYLHELAFRYLPDDGVASAASTTAIVILVLGMALMTMKILFWLPALAIGDRAATLTVSWRNTRGAVWPFIPALCLPIAPIVAMHVIVNTLEKRLPVGQVAGHLMLFAETGVVSTLLLMWLLASVSAVYSLTKNRGR